MRANDELISMGLKPMTWAEVLQEVEDSLDPEGRAAFARLHRNFVGYLSPDTLDRFYGFVFTQGLHLALGGYRFHRLSSVLGRLLTLLPPGLSILDVGAGAGFLARAVARCCSPRALIAQDPCREARAYLASEGLQVLPHPAPAVPPMGPFDRILCVDSLGEVNADDDGLLAHPGRLPPEERLDLPQRIEERYGFAHKLEAWKPYLAPEGKVLLWEPIADPVAWEAIASGLAAHGWKATVQGYSAKNMYLELDFYI
ncbi:MAG TPA: class I SAM-dependent methyltransferase [Fibrobacteria bacterium]|nr:class I SAM-dependent methyltransferase [Fibrobacteria bacterium]